MGINNVSSSSNSTVSDVYKYYNIDGVIKADSGDLEKALASFNMAIEENPKDFVSYFNRASIKMDLGDIEGARIDFKRAANLASVDRYPIA